MDLSSWWSSGKDLKWAGEDKKMFVSVVSGASAAFLADPVSIWFALVLLKLFYWPWKMKCSGLLLWEDVIES